MTESFYTLRELGWSAAFQAQLEIDEIAATEPMRVASIARNGVDLVGTGGPRRIATGAALAEGALAVGDWLLIERATGRAIRVLERQTLLQRRAAGTGRAVQPIAANVDTLFVVSSCNADFNPARLERYLALARRSGVVPVVLLTKRDACGDPDAYVARAAKLAANLVVEALNAHDDGDVGRLLARCGTGQTVALVGSSGVGKSTIINRMTGAAQATRAIREDDAAGRHTTTARSLHRLPSGGWLIDTPGMRALRLYDAADGIEAVFDDVATLAETCRFVDCTHESEPGCAVQAAVAAGGLEPGRLERWRKLMREDARNTASIAEQRRAARAMGRVYRSAREVARRKRGE